MGLELVASGPGPNAEDGKPWIAWGPGPNAEDGTAKGAVLEKLESCLFQTHINQVSRIDRCFCVICIRLS